MDSFALRLTEHGAARLDRAALSLVGPLLDILTPITADRPGIRLHGLSRLSALLAAEGPIGSVAAASAGRPLQPVRAILFDKTAATNWALGWHQDRTIAVRERIEVAGYGPWTVKAGLTHVEPPFAVIERMLTLRVHLDAVPPDNAPLLVAPGSHRLGRIAEADIADVAERHGAVAAWRWLETYGPMRRPSSMLPPRRRGEAIAVCCRSTIRTPSCPVACAGQGWTGSNLRAL